MGRSEVGLGNCSQNCHKPQAMPGGTLEAKKNISVPPSHIRGLWDLLGIVSIMIVNKTTPNMLVNTAGTQSGR